MFSAFGVEDHSWFAMLIRMTLGSDCPILFTNYSPGAVAFSYTLVTMLGSAWRRLLAWAWKVEHWEWYCHTTAVPLNQLKDQEYIRDRPWWHGDMWCVAVWSQFFKSNHLVLKDLSSLDSSWVGASIRQLLSSFHLLYIYNIYIYILIIFTDTMPRETDQWQWLLCSLVMLGIRVGC